MLFRSELLRTVQLIAFNYFNLLPVLTYSNKYLHIIQLEMENVIIFSKMFFVPVYESAEGLCILWLMVITGNVSPLARVVKSVRH